MYVSIHRYEEVTDMCRSPPWESNAPVELIADRGKHELADQKRANARSQRSRVMATIHKTSANSNGFTGAVGRGPARQTRYGLAIDVVRIDCQERTWGDLVPTNPEVMGDLRCGTCVAVDDIEVVETGYRPTWRGTVRIIG